MKEGNQFEQADPKNTDRALTSEEMMKEPEEFAEQMRKLMKLVGEGKVTDEVKYDEKTGDIVGRIKKDEKGGETVFGKKKRTIDFLIKHLDDFFHLPKRQSRPSLRLS